MRVGGEKPPIASSFSKVSTRVVDDTIFSRGGLSLAGEGTGTVPEIPQPLPQSHVLHIRLSVVPPYRAILSLAVPLVYLVFAVRGVLFPHSAEYKRLPLFVHCIQRSMHALYRSFNGCVCSKTLAGVSLYSPQVSTLRVSRSHQDFLGFMLLLSYTGTSVCVVGLLT